MNRAHGIAVSLVLGAAAATGTVALGKSAKLGLASHQSATRAPVATVRARARRLDAWARSLDGALAKRPPALPAVPRFGQVSVPSYAVPAAAPAAAAAAPAPVAATPRKTRRTTVRFVTARSQPKDLAAGRAASSDTPSDPAPTSAPATTTTETPPPPTVAGAPAPAPAPSSQPTSATTSKDGAGEPEDSKEDRPDDGSGSGSGPGGDD